MATSTRVVEQSIVPAHGSLNVKTVSLHQCSLHIQRLIQQEPKTLGFAVTWNEEQDAIGISFATQTDVLFISLPRSGKKPMQNVNWDALQRLLVQDELPELTLVAFDCSKIALALHRQFGLSTRAADLGNYFRTDKNRDGPLQNIRKALMGLDLDQDELLNAVGPDAVGVVDDGGESAWMQSWIFGMTGARILDLLLVNDASTRRLDTRLVSQEHLDCLSLMQHQFDILENARPNEMKNDFSEIFQDPAGNHIVRNERYSNKIRLNRNQIVVLEDDNGKEIRATAVGSKGKSTTIAVQGNKPITTKIKSIRVMGKDDNTLADAERIAFVVGVLQGRHDIDQSSFIRIIWFKMSTQANKPPSKLLLKLDDAVPSPEVLSALNPSQRLAAMAMLNPARPVVVCHGPPGTGKTRTIAAVVKQYDGLMRGDDKETVWLCAQSNVGVKNIAEALIKAKVENFKLLVSKEFHYEWHEHIYYETLSDKLVRFDDISERHRHADILFSDVHIVLCTISMLSNPGLHLKGITKHVPVTRVIIDEASQIYVGQYMHLLHNYRKDLVKISFFGDPKQLPPYRSEDIAGLHSVFELRHLKKDAFFLNTQYRMPEPLGHFISGAVYDNKLKSKHEIRDVNSVVFVDMCKGSEQRDGKSWKNMGEVQTIVNLVRKYYRHKEFCVITPYEPQRAAIQDQLRRDNLPWENVFTVDSYQGNEADFALISLVRTNSPGFLKSKNRVNVMLTRCKRGMVIVSNKTFLQSSAKKTLLGEMERHWKTSWANAYPSGPVGPGVNSHWIDWKKVAQGTARLPGLIA
ncbi:hypothetical protein FRC02_000422 [Tulasnella sp. 418]|nr:hypothetical protein FRC02_000422 [Tulasnella sp. 418]